MLRRLSGIVLAATVVAVAPPARAQDASEQEAEQDAQPEVEQAPQEPVEQAPQQPVEQAPQQVPQPAAQPPLGIDLGLQVGFGLPYGRINESIPLVLNEVISSMVAIAADAGYRVDDLIAVGLRFQYGILQFRDAGEACGPGSNCRGSAFAVAAQGTLHAPVSWPVVPWLRLGAGYEWLRMRVTGDFMGAPADLSLRLRGWMFGFAELGGDYALLPQLAVGPFFGVSVGRYNFGADGSGPEGPLIYKRVHEWVVFGVRGAFSL